MRKQERRKTELQEMYLENLCEGHQFFDFMPSFTCHFGHFVLLSSSTPSPFSSDVLDEWPL